MTILSILKKLNKQRRNFIAQHRIRKYKSKGCIPWSIGYHEYKWREIAKAILNNDLINGLRNNLLPADFGTGIDERIIEYPLFISWISNKPGKLLDAGSSLNHEIILNHEFIKQKNISILNYAPEAFNFPEKGISYLYNDIRNLPFQNDWFDEVACISTLEHIGMDNSLYGHNDREINSEDYLIALKELFRVTKPGGRIFISVPFGLKKYYGFFQQFNQEMLNKIIEIIDGKSNYKISYFAYTSSGWQLSDPESCRQNLSYNPFTKEDRGTDGAAHSRSIAVLSISKHDLT